MAISAEDRFQSLVDGLPLSKAAKQKILAAHKACLPKRRRRTKFHRHLEWAIRHWCLGHSYAAIGQDEKCDWTTIRNALREMSEFKQGCLRMRDCAVTWPDDGQRVFKDARVRARLEAAEGDDAAVVEFQFPDGRVAQFLFHDLRQ